MNDVYTQQIGRNTYQVRDVVVTDHTGTTVVVTRERNRAWVFDSIVDASNLRAIAHKGSDHEAAAQVAMAYYATRREVTTQ